MPARLSTNLTTRSTTAVRVPASEPRGLLCSHTLVTRVCVLPRIHARCWVVGANS